MSLFKTKLTCLTILLLSTITSAKKESSYEESIIPKIYKILEQKNKIIIQKTASAEFNRAGLLDFLQKNANLEYRVENILSKNEEINSGMKKRWIKRKIPHNQETPDLAYDKDFGLAFKPLVRLHKTKKIHLANEKRIPKLTKVQNELNSLRTMFDLERMKDSMMHIKTYTSEAAHVIDHMREVDAIIGEIGLPYLSGYLHQILKKHHHEIATLIESLHKEILSCVKVEGNKYLRESLRTSKKTAPENRDLLDYLIKVSKSLRGGAPKIEDKEEVTEPPTNIHPIEVGGLLLDPDLGTNEITELPCALFPHQPMWNHWTYGHMIYKDVCPRGQIKIGTICSKIPGHRKR